MLICCTPKLGDSRQLNHYKRPLEHYGCEVADRALRCNAENSQPNTETEAHKIVQCQTEASQLPTIYNPTEASALR